MIRLGSVLFVSVVWISSLSGCSVKIPAYNHVLGGFAMPGTYMGATLSSSQYEGEAESTRTQATYRTGHRSLR